MACNRETSADGSTSSAPPACQNSEALVPCCNNNCHFFGCAATMNLCSRCYSEHILKEGGGVFLDKSSDHATVDAPIVSDPILERSEEASPPAMPANDQSGLRDQNSKDSSMNRSAGVSDLHAIFRSAQSSDLPQQRIPSPLSLPSRPKSPRAFSPIRRQVEINKVSSMPPLPPRQQAVSRCLACRKRVGLLGFKCRCGDIFCALHRYSDKHDCSFDYKAAGRAVIAKENPVVKASKIERI